MRAKLAIFGVGLAILILLGLFFWNHSQKAQAEDFAKEALEEASQWLDQAANSSGSAARDARVKALRRAEEILRRSPDSSPGLLLLGRAQAALGDRAKACQAFDRLLEREPQHPEALLEGGIAYLERWRLSKDRAHWMHAEKNLQTAQGAEATSLAAMLHLGELYHEEREFQKRDAIWDRLQAAAPDSSQARKARSIRSNSVGE